MFAMPTTPQTNALDHAFRSSIARGFGGSERLMPGFTRNLYPQGTRGYMRNPAYDNPFNEQSHYNARYYNDSHGFYQPRMNPGFARPSVGRFGPPAPGNFAVPSSAAFGMPMAGAFAPPPVGQFAVPNPCGGPRMPNGCPGSSTPWIPMGNPCGAMMPMGNPAYAPPMPGRYAPPMAGAYAPPGAAGYAPPMSGSFTPPPSGMFAIPNPGMSRSVEFDVRVTGTVRRQAEFEKMIGLPSGGPSLPMPATVQNPAESCPPGMRWRSSGPGFGGQCVPMHLASLGTFGGQRTAAFALNPPGVAGLPFRTVAAPFGFPVNGNGNGFAMTASGPTGAWAGYRNDAGRALAARAAYGSRYDSAPMPNNGARPAGTRRPWSGLRSPRRLSGATARNPGHGACCDACAEGKACTGCGGHGQAGNPCGCGANKHVA